MRWKQVFRENSTDIELNEFRAVPVELRRFSNSRVPASGRPDRLSSENSKRRKRRTGPPANASFGFEPSCIGWDAGQIFFELLGQSIRQISRGSTGTSIHG